MPIKGFRERKRMRRVGKVRLGIKLVSRRTGQEYPSPTDYFVLHDAPGLGEIYGEKPRLLNILMVSDDLEITFPFYMMRYRRRGLMCLGDGEKILRRRGDPETTIQNGAEVTTYPWAVRDGVNIETGQVEPCLGLECPFAIRPEKGQAECRPTGRLRFICADHPTHGYYQLDVHKRAIEGFLGQLDFARAIVGRITGYPWQLILEQETVQLESGQRKLWIPQLQIEPKIFADLLRRRYEGLELALPKGITEPTPEMEAELTEDLDYEPSQGSFPDNDEEVLQGERLDRAWDILKQVAQQRAIDGKFLRQVEAELTSGPLTAARFDAARDKLKAWEPPHEPIPEPAGRPHQGGQT